MSALMNPESDIARSSAPAAENDIIFSWYRKATLADGNKRQAVLCSQCRMGRTGISARQTTATNTLSTVSE